MNQHKKTQFVKTETA